MNLAVDMGYGFIKVMSDDGTKNKFPSFALKLENKLDQDISHFDYAIKVNGKQFKVGEYAQLDSNASRELKKEHQLDADKIPAFLGTALNLISKSISEDENEDVNISLGLPVDFYKEQKDKLETMLEEMVLKTEFRGAKKNFAIKRITITQQGVAAFRALFSTEKGEGRKGNFSGDAFYLQGGGLIDIGYNTADFVVITKMNGKFVMADELSASFEKTGSTFAHEEATKQLNKDLGCQFKSAYYESRLKENGGIMFFAGNKIDLNAYFEQGYKELSDEIIDKINTLWNRSILKSFGALYLTGGTANKIKKYMKIPDVEIRLQHDSVYSNCIGLLSKLNLELKREQKTNIIALKKDDEKSAQN